VKRTLVALLLASSTAVAAPWEKSGIDWTRPPPSTAEPVFRVPRGERFQLANGVTVIVSEHHALPLASIAIVLVGSGAASDPVGLSGLAGLTADLVDEGAGDLDAMGIAAAADALGSTVDVESDPDATYVVASLLPRALPQTLDLLAKIITQPRFDASDFARVHEDRKTDAALRDDSGDRVAGVVAAAMVFGPGTPYGRPGLGLRAELAAIKREDVLAFYGARWRPERMVVVVTGDVTLAELRPLVERSFGKWRPAAAPAIAATPEPRPSSPPARLILVDRPGAEQSDVRFVQMGPRFGEPGSPALEVAQTILGGMFTSRLVRRIREQLGYAYSIGARWVRLRAASPISIRAGFHTPKTAAAIKEVLAIVAAMAARPVPEAELRKAQQFLIRGYPDQFATNQQTAFAFAEMALYDLPLDFHEKFLAALLQVTPADVQAAVKTHLAVDRLTVVIVGDLKVILPSLRKLKLGKALKSDPEGNILK